MLISSVHITAFFTSALYLNDSVTYCRTICVFSSTYKTLNHLTLGNQNLATSKSTYLITTRFVLTSWDFSRNFLLKNIGCITRLKGMFSSTWICCAVVIRFLFTVALTRSLCRVLAIARVRTWGRSLLVVGMTSATRAATSSSLTWSVS